MAQLSLIVPWLMGPKTPWTHLYLWVKLTHEVTAPLVCPELAKAWSWRKGTKKTLKSPMDPLWGPKHLRSSYFCELSLHTEFQSNSTSPSIKLILHGNNNMKRKVTENSGNLVPSLLRKGDQSFSLNALRQGKRRRSCQYHKVKYAAPCMWLNFGSFVRLNKPRMF